MEGPEASSSIPGFSSLSLSRPDSYSAAGRVADASIHAVKQPQPMLYSPASGLVTYEPPGLTGVAHMQWLERLSSPKVLKVLAGSLVSTATARQRQLLLVGASKVTLPERTPQERLTIAAGST
ncbi:hypothetical protein OEZ86_004031 [Tetradesmus obliquus]|nr:hypothetical protein OEZ86_004031 [Tetradesmus obliquus]